MAETPASPNSAPDLEIVDNSKQPDLPFAEEDTVVVADSEIVEIRESEEKSESNDEQGGGKTKVDKNGDTKRDSELLEVFTSSTDKKSIRSRVFVGHLHTSKVTRRDLESFFNKSGKIIAVSLLKGYGFVQFDNEESALKAIAKYHGSMFFGSRLVVDKPAAWKRLDGENPHEKKPWPEEGEGESTKRSSHRSPDSERWPSSSRDDRHHASHHREYDDDIPSRYRDPEYERYLEMRYMEERLTEKYRYDRLYDNYPSRYDYMSHRGAERYDYPPQREYDYPVPPPPSRSYDYYRDDDFGRERRPFDVYRY